MDCWPDRCYAKPGHRQTAPPMRRPVHRPRAAGTCQAERESGVAQAGYRRTAGLGENRESADNRLITAEARWMLINRLIWRGGRHSLLSAKRRRISRRYCGFTSRDPHAAVWKALVLAGRGPGQRAALVAVPHHWSNLHRTIQRWPGRCAHWCLADASSRGLLVCSVKAAPTSFSLPLHPLLGSCG